VWAGAIALFFNRWGKIRMLLPYQPDYKQEQLKVPGAGACANTTCNGQHSHQVNHPTFNLSPYHNQFCILLSIVYVYVYAIVFCCYNSPHHNGSLAIWLKNQEQ
jgi:hypothetical protein